MIQIKVWPLINLRNECTLHLTVDRYIPRLCPCQQLEPAYSDSVTDSYAAESTDGSFVSDGHLKKSDDFPFSAMPPQNVRVQFL